MQAEQPPINSPGTTTPPRWLTVVLLSALIGAGAFLRVYLTLDRPLWDDELWQRFVVQQSTWRDLLLWQHAEPVHPPLSFMLNRLCLDICQSDAAWVWRLPSLLAGVLCIPAAFAIGRRLGSIAWAFGAAAMVAFDLNVVWESANARMYAMLALGTIVAIGVAWPILHPDETSRRRAIWLGVVLALLIWTHMLAVLIWGAFGLAAAFLLVRSWRDQHRREMIENVAIACGVACLLGLPGVLRFLAVGRGVGAAVPDRTPCGNPAHPVLGCEFARLDSSPVRQPARPVPLRRWCDNNVAPVPGAGSSAPRPRPGDRPLANPCSAHASILDHALFHSGAADSVVRTAILVPAGSACGSAPLRGRCPCAFPRCAGLELHPVGTNLRDRRRECGRIAGFRESRGFREDAPPAG